MDLDEVSALPKPPQSYSCARSRDVQTNLGVTPGRGRRLVSPRFAPESDMFVDTGTFST